MEDEIAEGDRVVQRITCYGTHQGEFCGVRPTGEQVAFSSIEINRAAADGKFTEHWSSADLLGVLPSQGGVGATALQRAKGITPVPANKAAQADQVAVGGSQATTMSGHGGAGHRAYR